MTHSSMQHLTGNSTIGEALKEYIVVPDLDNPGSTLGGILKEVASPSLYSFRKNGKYGWINSNNEVVIPPEYDSDQSSVYHGVLILSKNRRYGGYYRKNLKQAFSFKYRFLQHLYNETHLACDDDGWYYLVKPGDKTITRHKYIGFLKDNGIRYGQFRRRNFWGKAISGYIDYETGIEITYDEYQRHLADYTCEKTNTTLVTKLIRDKDSVAIIFNGETIKLFAVDVSQYEINTYGKKIYIFEIPCTLWELVMPEGTIRSSSFRDCPNVWMHYIRGGKITTLTRDFASKLSNNLDIPVYLAGKMTLPSSIYERLSDYGCVYNTHEWKDGDSDTPLRMVIYGKDLQKIINFGLEL